jgi:arylformamidase
MEAVSDWDDAYANADHIPGAEGYPPRWAAAAAAFRAATGARAEIDIAYGDAPRQRLDLFRPDGAPRGLAVFVHGGYWRRFGKSDWSHLAAAAVAAGWAVAMPQYSLAPAARIHAITHEVGAAIDLLAMRIDGPIRLAGHSAGGHLAARMVCRDTPSSRRRRTLKSWSMATARSPICKKARARFSPPGPPAGCTA